MINSRTTFLKQTKVFWSALRNFPVLCTLLQFRKSSADLSPLAEWSVVCTRLDCSCL